MYERLLEGNFVHPGTVLVRRSALDRAGPFDESLRHATEYDLIVRLARLGPIAFVDAPLNRYRLWAGQLSNGVSRIWLDTIAVLEKVRHDDPAYAARLAECAAKMLDWRLGFADRTLTGYRATPNGLEVRAA